MRTKLAIIEVVSQKAQKKLNSRLTQIIISYSHTGYPHESDIWIRMLDGGGTSKKIKKNRNKMRE